jgi:hypothetical protein
MARWGELVDKSSEAPMTSHGLGSELPLVSLRGRELRFHGRPGRQTLRAAIDMECVIACADPRQFDAAVEGVSPGDSMRIELRGDVVPGALQRCAIAVATRLQRWLDRRNTASCGEVFERVLALHRELYDLDKPLVRADWEHALDTWQWVLRLDPDAGVAVQVAALFHDVERLASEADRRMEHLASNYAVFKDAHARAGAETLRKVLANVGLPRASLEAAAALVATHERRGGGERAVLNDADALSFFSLSSPDFADYFPAAHTARKIGWTLARLAPAQYHRLDAIHLRRDVRALCEAVPAPAGA